MELHEFCQLADLSEKEFLIKEINGKSIGAILVDGVVHTILNYCPHEAAEVCKGKVTGTVLPSNVGEYLYDGNQKVISCPWHGWEFDIKSGKALFESEKSYRLKTIKNSIVNNKIYVGV